MHTDNKGLTLVELIIAIAVSTIIIGAATIFLRTSIVNYNYASDEVSLQSEAQILMEQIGMWVMEGNRVQVDASGTQLTIYQIPRTTTTTLPAGMTQTGEATKRVIWLSDGKLYTEEFTGIADADNDTVCVDATYETKENCIGEYVSVFTPVVDTAQSDSVNIHLELQTGSQTYEINDEFKVRNEIK